MPHREIVGNLSTEAKTELEKIAEALKKGSLNQTQEQITTQKHVQGKTATKLNTSSEAVQSK